MSGNSIASRKRLLISFIPPMEDHGTFGISTVTDLIADGLVVRIAYFKSSNVIPTCSELVGGGGFSSLTAEMVSLSRFWRKISLRIASFTQSAQSAPFQRNK